MHTITTSIKSKRSELRLLALALTVLMLSACGSTKVYTNDKTVVYKGDIYNVSAVKQIDSSVTAKLADGSTVDLTQADKKKVQSVLKANGPAYVTMKFNLDSGELVYRAKSVNKYSDYSKMRSDFDSANKQIIQLMGDKKKRQLKLK